MDIKEVFKNAYISHIEIGGKKYISYIIKISHKAIITGVEYEDVVHNVQKGYKSKTFGPIEVFFNVFDNKFYIIDGNHRLAEFRKKLSPRVRIANENSDRSPKVEINVLIGYTKWNGLRAWTYKDTTYMDLQGLF